MKAQKVYDADGKQVDTYNKPNSKMEVYTIGHTSNQRIRALNAAGYYVKGQVTSKGVKIK